MKMSRKVTNFTKQVLAQLSGDTDTAIAMVNERKCNSALESQIAVLKGKIVDQEEVVKEKQEALLKAKFPTTKVENRETYLQKIRYAQEAVDNAEEDLESTKGSIAYWEYLVAEYAEQVDSSEKA